MTTLSKKGCNCLSCFNEQLAQEKAKNDAIMKEQQLVIGSERRVSEGKGCVSEGKGRVSEGKGCVSEGKGWYRDPKNLVSMSQYLNPAVVKVDENGNVVVPPIDSPLLWKYKTVMCKSWLLTQACPYEERCRFAHGEHELKQTTNAGEEHPKYKTKSCKNFTISGLCPFGARCLFVHPIKESTPKPQRSMPNANFTRLDADREAGIRRIDADYMHC